MPVTKSATKALRQSLKKASHNRHLTALYREASKDFDKTIALKDAKAGMEKLAELYSRLDVLTKHNILHRNNAARKKSKAAQTLKTLALSQ